MMWNRSRIPCPRTPTGRIRCTWAASAGMIPSENTLNLWVVADNLRKGAALNAVQIAEALIEKGMLRTAPVK